MLLLCIILAVALRYSTSSPNYWFIAWPGTIVHELFHYITALLTMGSPNGFTVIPRTLENGGQVLGSVSCDNLNWFNSLPIGLAPLLGLPLGLWMSTKIHMDWSISGLFWMWVIASIISQSLPSNADFRVAFANPMGIVLWGTMAFVMLK